MLYRTNEETRKRLRTRLIRLGFEFGTKQKRQGIAAQTLFDARVKWLFDSTIRRCVAKIAFNHLACVTEQRYDFLARDDFDAVRNYIRLGPESDEKEPDFVFMAGEPQLGFSSPPPIGGGHLMVTAWDATSQAIISHVSVFGAVRYTVILCNRYSGVWFDIRGGHYFDIGNKEVRKVA